MTRQVQSKSDCAAGATGSGVSGVSDASRASDARRASRASRASDASRTTAARARRAVAREHVEHGHGEREHDERERGERAHAEWERVQRQYGGTSHLQCKARVALGQTGAVVSEPAWKAGHTARKDARPTGACSERTCRPVRDGRRAWRAACKAAAAADGHCSRRSACGSVRMLTCSLSSSAASFSMMTARCQTSSAAPRSALAMHRVHLTCTQQSRARAVRCMACGAGFSVGQDSAGTPHDGLGTMAACHQRA